MRDNIVTADFSTGRMSRTAAVWQWDHGLRLKLTGVELPAGYEVHFGNAADGDSVTMIGDETGVDIPDQLLTEPGVVMAWVYLHTGEDDGETVLAATIPVQARAAITDEEPTPAQQTAIEQAIGALARGVARAEDAAEAAEDSAEAAEQAVQDGLEEAIPSIVAQTVAQTEEDVADLKSHVEELDDHVQCISPRASVSKTGNTATITISDQSGTSTAQISDGEKGDPGDPGEPGQDGVSPTVTITEITGGHRITITDATGAHSADVMDGEGSVQDVQVNGVSVLDAQGVANVPMAKNRADTGVVKINQSFGITETAGILCLVETPIGDAKTGASQYRALLPSIQHASAFYGLAKAAGSDEKNSTLPLGQYTESAKSAIQTMLGVEQGVNFVEEVSGTAVTITGVANTRYKCGTVTTITITPPALGTIDVVFTSGSTAAALTLPSTVKVPDWFDQTALDTDTTYELVITDGVYCGVMAWAE